MAKQRISKHLLCKHAPPEENCGLGDRVARFSKVVKEANNVEIGIFSLTTNEQSRETQRRGNRFDVLVSDTVFSVEELHLANMREVSIETPPGWAGSFSWNLQ